MSDDEFSKFVHDHAASLLRTAYVLTGGNKHVAEDLAQDALLKTADHWARVSRTEQPVAYSRRILINLHLDQTRRRGRWRLTPLPDSLTQDDGIAGPLQGRNSDPTGDLVSAHQDLKIALAGLPTRQRAAVALRYYEGLGIPEIADLMGIGESSVRSAISRALPTLRGSLALNEQEQHHAVER